MKESMSQNRPLKKPLLILTLITIVALSYSNATDGGFIWDDNALILDQKAIKEIQPFSYYFSTPFWPRSPETTSQMAYFRPLTVLSYAIDFQIYGENAFGFHLTNILFHILNCILLFFLMLKFGIRDIIAAVSSAIWAVLPRLTETVTWISGRTDLMAATFVFSSFLILPWLNPNDDLKKTAVTYFRLLLGFFFIFCGMLFKEAAVSAIGVVFLMTLFNYFRNKSKYCSYFAAYLISIASIMVIYFINRYLVFGDLSLPSSSPLETSKNVITILETCGRYASMILNPFTPNSEIGLVGSPAIPYVAGGFITYIIVPYLIFHFRSILFSSPHVFGMVIFLCSISMVLRILPIHLVTVAADRFLYIPTAGLAILAASIANNGIQKPHKYVVMASVLLISSLSAATYIRNLDWNDELQFWLKTSKDAHKSNIFPKCELSNILYRNGHLDEALRLSESIYRSLDDSIMNNDLTNIFIKSNLAGFYMMSGRPQESKPFASGLLNKFPFIPQVQYLNGMLALNILDFTSARKYFVETLHLMPDFQTAKRMLEATNEAENDWSEIRALLDKTSSLSPKEQFKIANFFTLIGNHQTANKYWHSLVNDAAVNEEEMLRAVLYFVSNGDMSDVMKYSKMLFSIFPHTQSERELNSDISQREYFERSYDKHKVEIADLIAAK